MDPSLHALEKMVDALSNQASLRRRRAQQNSVKIIYVFSCMIIYLNMKNK
jgi:hypothetical protein